MTELPASCDSGCDSQLIIIITVGSSNVRIKSNLAGLSVVDCYSHNVSIIHSPDVFERLCHVLIILTSTIIIILSR